MERQMLRCWDITSTNLKKKRKYRFGNCDLREIHIDVKITRTMSRMFSRILGSNKNKSRDEIFLVSSRDTNRLERRKNKRLDC